MIRRLPSRLAAASAALLLAAAPALADHHEETKAPDIRGSYAITGGEKYGEKIPAATLKDNRVTVTADRFAVVDKDNNNLYASTYKLMPAKDLELKNKKGVWFADLVSTIPEAGSKAPALIRVRFEGEGDEKKLVGMNLIYSLSDQRPTKFKTGPKDLMFKLKKTASPAGE